jgi:hypothetical protein
MRELVPFFRGRDPDFANWFTGRLRLSRYVGVVYITRCDCGFRGYECFLVRHNRLKRLRSAVFAGAAKKQQHQANYYSLQDINLQTIASDLKAQR